MVQYNVVGKGRGGFTLCGVPAGRMGGVYIGENVGRILDGELHDVFSNGYLVPLW